MACDPNCETDGDCAQCRPPEQAIRADERAKVEAEVVAFLRHTPMASGQLISIESSNDLARLAQDIERGEHRQKAGT